MKKKYPIGFVCGPFDLCHAGHLMMFEECKSYCDRLVVGLNIDPRIERPGKNKPVETVFQRYLRLRSNKFIDEIIPYGTSEDKKAILELLIAKYGHENILRFMDEDYARMEYGADDKWAENFFDLKIHYTSRKHLYSSTALRRLICKNKET